MLKSSDDNPYTGKLSKEDNYSEAIFLAELCRKFAKNGETDEAMNIPVEDWDDVIKLLNQKKKMSNFTIQELEFIKSELKYCANFAPEENTEEENILYNSIDRKITVIIEQLNQNKEESYSNWDYDEIINKRRNWDNDEIINEEDE